jgi:hypothetical protein
MNRFYIETNIRKTSCLSPSPKSIERNGKPESYHLEYLEWFARCGVVPHIPALQTAVDEIADSIDEDGICRIPVSDDIFLVDLLLCHINNTINGHLR